MSLLILSMCTIACVTEVHNVGWAGKSLIDPKSVHSTNLGVKTSFLRVWLIIELGISNAMAFGI